MEITVRRIREDELGQLLSLYEYLNPNDEKPSDIDLIKVWTDIMKNPDKYIYLAAVDGSRLAATCNMTIIPNLTRGAKSFAVIENVITHPDYRRQGLGRIVMDAAIQIAKKASCYKVMLLSSSERSEAHLFYESLGFTSDEKIGFVKKI